MSAKARFKQQSLKTALNSLGFDKELAFEIAWRAAEQENSSYYDEESPTSSAEDEDDDDVYRWCLSAQVSAGVRNFVYIQFCFCCFLCLETLVNLALFPETQA